jgi:HNH endonuclease
MKLQSVHTDCIWCGRRLVHSSNVVDCEENFGPRPRSDEHIIPRAVFGKVITTDLCKCCNDEFGAMFDHALVRDQKIVEAAKRVAVKETDLWSRFEGVQQSPRGRKIKIAYSKGSFRPKAQLQELDELSVPIINGSVSENDLKHLGARLFEKVRKRQDDLTTQQIRASVESLLAKMRQDPTRTYHDSIIGETVEPTQLGTQLIYTQETKPWETQWCLAKIVFELSQSLWPKNYGAYFKLFLDQWRSFLEKQECSSDGTQGVGIFDYEDLLPETAVREHVIEGIVSTTEMSWSLTFFGTARWKFPGKFEPVLQPPHYPSYRIRIVNPIGNSSGDAEVKITELH